MSPLVRLTNALRYTVELEHHRTAGLDRAMTKALTAGWSIDELAASVARYPILGNRITWAETELERLAGNPPPKPAEPKAPAPAPAPAPAARRPPAPSPTRRAKAHRNKPQSYLDARAALAAQLDTEAQEQIT